MFSQTKRTALSGIIPEELEYVPEGYTQPAQHPGTLEKLEYQTWESFSYAEKSQKLTKTAWVYLPYGYDESKQYNGNVYVRLENAAQAAGFTRNANGSINVPQDGSQYVPKASDVIRCDDGTNYTITAFFLSSAPPRLSETEIPPSSNMQPKTPD